VTSRRMLVALCFVFLAGPLEAQRRIYSRVVAPPTPEAFQSPTTAELGRLLRGGSLAPPASVLVAPHTAASLTRVDTIRARRRTCPMPVLAPDSARFAAGPIPVRDSLSRDPMPTFAPLCENPLRR
jgi:hypothetical protein